MSIASIAVDRLSNPFGRRSGHQQLSFDIRAGEMVALIGPSSSERSALLRHLKRLTTINRPAESHIRIIGRRIQKEDGRLNDPHLARHRISYIPRKPRLIGWLSVIANVLVGRRIRLPLGCTLLGRYSTEERATALRVLKRVGLADLAEQNVYTLTKGQAQRVAIARALMQEPDIILADEPIGSLDPKSAHEVMELLRRINAEDKCIVFVSLDQAEHARHYFHRAVALKQKKVYFDGLTSELTASRLKMLYGNINDRHQLLNGSPSPGSPLYALPPHARVVLVTGTRRKASDRTVPRIYAAIADFSQRYPDIFFAYPAHINPQDKPVLHAMLGDKPNVLLLDSLDFTSFAWLLKRVFLIIADSEKIEEESRVLDNIQHSKPFSGDAEPLVEH